MIVSSSLWSVGAALALLGNLAVKATLMLSAMAVLDFLLGQKRPLARCGLWHATLAALAVLPLASLSLPSFAITRPSPHPAVVNAYANETAPVPPAVTQAAGHVENAGPSFVASRFHSAEAAPNVEINGASVFSTSILAIYLFGGAVLTFRLAMSLRAGAALSARAAPLVDAPWSELLADWRRRLGVARSVRLFASPEVTVPVQIGWLRPAILLPPRVATSCDEGTRTAVLVHELGHVRRGDYLWNLTLHIVTIFYWPHPLIWLAGRRIARLREQACDDLCIHWLGGAAVYRSRLIELAARLLQKPVASLGMAMSKAAKLSRRLEWLDASQGRPHCVPSTMVRRSAIVAMLLVAAVLGAARSGRSIAEAQEVKAKAPDDAKPAATPIVSDDERPQPRAVETDDPPDALEPATADDRDKPDGQDKPDESRPVRVRVARVKRQDLTVVTTQPCQLAAARTMSVYARLPGEVKRLAVEIGDRVVKGQTLAEVDSPELAPEAAQAEAIVAAAEAELEQSRAAVREAEAKRVSSKADQQGAEAEVEAAEVKLVYAKKRHVRTIKLAEQRAVDTEAVDKTEEDLSAAQAGIKVVKAHLESVKALVGPREAAVTSAQAAEKLAAARLRVAEAKLAQAKLQGAEARLVSPLDGIVIEIDAHVGDFVGRADKNVSLCTVADLRQMRATIAIPAQDAVKIKRGSPARVSVDALPGKALAAEVSQVGFNINPATATMTVVLTLATEDTDARLLPGMFGVAAVALEVHRNVLSVPWPTFEHVLAVVDGRAEPAQVRLRGRSYDRIEVISGLKEGDLVITGLADDQQKQPDWAKRPRVEIVELPEK